VLLVHVMAQVKRLEMRCAMTYMTYASARGNVLHWRMSCGSSFQSRRPDTEKRRSPRVVSVRGTDNESSLEERIECALVRVASTRW